MPKKDDPYRDELKRRGGPDLDPGDALDEEIGSWIQQALRQDLNAQLNDDMDHADLDPLVATQRDLLQKARKRNLAHSHFTVGSSSTRSTAPYPSHLYPSKIVSTGSGVLHINASPSEDSHFLTVMSPPGEGIPPKAYGIPSESGIFRSEDTSTIPAIFPSLVISAGSGIFPEAHVIAPGNVILSSGVSDSGSIMYPSVTYRSGAYPTTGYFDKSMPVSVKEDMSLVAPFVPATLKRVFHPQKGGYAMIANLIMYAMAARNAASLGTDIPPRNLTDTGDSCPLPPSPACDGSSSDTWSSRDSAISAVASFCADYQNLAGSAGKMNSATFNNGSLDYLSVSIAWDDDVSIGENQCNNWFGTVVDGCDTNSSGNLKHGGSVGFATNATLSVDPLVMRRQWDGPHIMNPQCNGLANDNYVTQATLLTNIQDFCAQSAAQNIAISGSTFTKDYNAGTLEHVTLTTTWPTGILNFQVFPDECNYYMSTITNGCDVPSPDNNPMNWKHGGSMKDNNGVNYIIVPKAMRAPSPNKVLGNCNSKYAFLFATFHVYGGGWANSDFGHASGGLYAQIRGCGLITKWKFKYFDEPHPDGTEWHASGRLPIGTGSCLGRAVTSAGGFTGGCG